MIKTLLDETRIILDLDAKTKEQAISKLISISADHLYNEELFFNDVMKRENELSTGLTHGITIPHSQSYGVKESFISIAKVSNVLSWEMMDDSLAKFIILIGVPKSNASNEHLSILAEIAGKLIDEFICRRLIKSNNKLEIIKILEG